MSGCRIANCYTSSVVFSPFTSSKLECHPLLTASPHRRRAVSVRATAEPPNRDEFLDIGTPDQPNARSQLDLLEKLISSQKRDPTQMTVAEQLASKASSAGIAEDAVVPLGKKVPVVNSDLTISQSRNIRRQQYLDRVGKRNDGPFFATIAAFVILPPAIILGVAVAVGYVELFP